MSQRPGSTLIPSVEITSAPSGIATSPTRPTALIRSPSISTTLFSSGRPPWPSISRPPTSALTEAAKAGPPPRVSNRRNVAIWRMGLLPPSGVDFVQELVEQMVEGLGAVHHQPVAGAGHQTGRQVGNQSVQAVGEGVHVADDRELRSLVALQGGERAGAEGAFQGADDGVLVSAPKIRQDPAPRVAVATEDELAVVGVELVEGVFAQRLEEGLHLLGGDQGLVAVRVGEQQAGDPFGIERGVHATTRPA